MSYAGREPFAKDFLRRWVYQKVGDLMPEDFLKRLDHVGHGGGGHEGNLSGQAIDLRAHGEIDHLLNEAITMFRFSAQKYLEAVPKDPGEQEFRLSDFTDALNVQEYIRQMQGSDLLDTLKDAVEFYYLGKIDENKKDSGNKLVKEKMREILTTIVDQKKIKEKLEEEIKKLKDPETAKKDQEFKTKEAELAAKAGTLRKKIGLAGKEKVPEAKSTNLELSATTPEGKEVKINLAERLKYWQDFYQENKIDWIKLPDTISITPEQQAEMTRLITVHGFDNLIIIPENLTTDPAHYTKLHELMSEGYAATATGSNYDNEGKFGGSTDKSDKLRLILTKDVQELDDDALFKSTLNKSIEDLEKDQLTKFTGLSESSYLIYQREYFKRTGQHLDVKRATWLPESTRPSSGRVPSGGWVAGGLDLGSRTRDGQADGLGCRLAGSFEI